MGDTDSVMIPLGLTSPFTTTETINREIALEMGSNRFNIKLEGLSVRFFAPIDVKKCYIEIIYKQKTESWQNGLIPHFKQIDFEEIKLNPVDFVEHKFKLHYP